MTTVSGKNSGTGIRPNCWRDLRLSSNPKCFRSFWICGNGWCASITCGLKTGKMFFVKCSCNIFCSLLEQSLKRQITIPMSLSSSTKDSYTCSISVIMRCDRLYSRLIFSIIVNPLRQSIPSGFRAAMSNWLPTRIMKNSSKLLCAIDKKKTRSNKGTLIVLASSNTRWLNCNQLISRFIVYL